MLKQLYMSVRKSILSNSSHLRGFTSSKRRENAQAGVVYKTRTVVRLPFKMALKSSEAQRLHCIIISSLLIHLK